VGVNADGNKSVIEAWSLATGGKSYGVADTNIGYEEKTEGGQTTFANINAGSVPILGIFGFQSMTYGIDGNRKEREYYGFSMEGSLNPPEIGDSDENKTYTKWFYAENGVLYEATNDDMKEMLGR